MTGSKVEQYEILDRLGGGGMGEIFRARDTRLNRMVAIKVLPKADADDDMRRRRFLLEAQSASALNHPGIITVHDILSEGDTDYLVMELVTGQTLTDLIPEGGMVPSDILNYGSQMAAAFAAAHAAGIVHRDIKPRNVMLTSTKLVKVLDFGLAKSPFKGSAPNTEQTVRAPLTQAGTVMGTVNYMSPEQAEGKNVDSRSDIFSFGIVLYEMVTGKSAFASNSVISTMSAILRDEPKPISALSPNTPAGLDDIINGCLRKNVDERTQSMDEVREALEALRRVYDPTTSPTVSRTAALRGSIAVPAPAARKPATLIYAIAALGVVVVGAGGWFIATRNKAPTPVEQ